jgi:hypothetical protein
MGDTSGFNGLKQRPTAQGKQHSFCILIIIKHTVKNEFFPACNLMKLSMCKIMRT